jgi:tetratricopeptide (TPR) repeat protein
MNWRKLHSHLLIVDGIAILVILAVAFLLPTGNRRAMGNYSPYILSPQSGVSAKLRLAEVAIEKIDSDADVFVRAMEAVDALSLLEQISPHENADVIQPALSLLGVESLAEFERDVVIPLKQQAGSGKDPLVDAVFAWIPRGYMEVDFEIPKLFVAAGQRTRAVAFLEKAIEFVVGKEERLDYVSEGYVTFYRLLGACIDLGETNLTYRYLPHLFASHLDPAARANDSFMLIELAGICRRLGQNEEAERYYDMAYECTLNEVAEIQGALWNFPVVTSSQLRIRSRLFGRKQQSASIAQGYFDLGKTGKANQVLRFITDHVINDTEFYDRNLYWMPEVATLYMLSGQQKQALELFKNGAEYFFRSRFVSDVSTPAKMILWYSEHGYEQEALRLVKRTEQSIPLTESFYRGRFIEELSDCELERFVPVVLAPMVDYTLGHDYKEQRFRVHGLLSIAQYFQKIGCDQEARSLLGDIESAAGGLDEVTEQIQAYDELAQLYLNLGAREDALRIMDCEGPLLEDLLPDDYYNDVHAKMSFRYINAGEHERARQSLAKIQKLVEHPELEDYRRLKHLAQLAGGCYRLSMKVEAEQALAGCYEVARRRGRPVKLVAVAKLMRDPFDPDALSELCW